MKYISLIFISLMFVSNCIHAQTSKVTVQVSQGSDDAEESENGQAVYISSSDLELVFDTYNSQNNQIVGIRFQNVTIPVDATITNAYIQFWVDESGDIETSLKVKGELAKNSLPFTEVANNISSRTTTSSEVSWEQVPAWNTSDENGENQRTPNLSSIVSEIISSNNWQNGNPMTFIISGEGKRSAVSYEGEPSQAATLVIEFETSYPIVDLGVNEVDGIDKYNTQEEDVEISTIIQNYGTVSVDSFSLSYTLDNGTPVRESVKKSLAPGETYSHEFAQTLDLNTLGEHTLRIDVSAKNDTLFVMNNSLVQTFNVTKEFSDIYFGVESFWKYLDDGSDLGSAWTEEQYDDSDWTIGGGQFGFGDGDEDFTLESGHITYYFRKIVDIEDIDEVSTVVMNLLADDAAVVYVNGQEVIRSVNLPEGSMSATTRPTRYCTDEFENTPLSYKLAPSLFHEGLNTLAIEVHNYSTTSSDISFSCEVVNKPIDYSVDGPYIFHRNDKIIVKKITKNGTEINTYAKGSEPTLTCDLPNGESFSFTLADKLEIPDPTHDMPEKFFVISDIEGQIDLFTLFLQSSGIIDENYNWTFGDGHLYYVGDMFDRGEYVTQCIWLLYKLEQEARLQGGGVHFVVGNHEIMNFTHDFRYVRDKYYANAHHLGEMLEDMYTPESELGAWFRTKNIIENAGESAIFLHGGISKDVSNLNLTYKEINDYGRQGMDDSYCRNGNSACKIVNGGSSQGIYWYRGIAREELAQSEVDEIMNSAKGEKMIIAHTVFPEISFLYDEKVIAVDLDHGDNYRDGYVAALHYRDGCYYEFKATIAGDTTFTPLDPECGRTGFNPLEMKDVFQVAPNPFSTQLSIRYSNELEGNDLYIFDLTGRLIQKYKINQHVLNINTAQWAKGTYILEVKSKNGSIVHRVVKQ